MMKAQKLMRLLSLVLVLSLCFGLLATSGLKLTANAANTSLTLKKGNSASTATVLYGTETLDTNAMKIGTSSKVGDFTITVPAGSTGLSFYAVSWKGTSGVQATLSWGTTTKTFDLTADDGITKNSPFTMVNNPNEGNAYKFTVTFDAALAADTDVKVTATKRAVFFCIESVSGGGGTTEPTDPTDPTETPCKHPNATSDVTTEATCVTPGVRTYTCPDCGKTWTEEIPAGGHAWDEGVVTKDPTCTEDGVKTYTCTKCGETKTEPITAPGHTDANADKVCDVCQANLAKPTFEKVTTAPTDGDWSGTYLIVCETEGVIFDGSLTTLDAANNNQSVTISGDQIEADLKYSFSIEKHSSGSNYTIKSASGFYIYQTSNANGLKSSTDEPKSGVSIGFAQDGDLEIISSSAHLRYNSASNDNRFRFYKSGSYANQKAISLYKLVESAPVTPVEPTVDGVVLNAVSATLEGDIGLNYYVTLPSSVRDAQGAEVRFTVNDVTKSVPVSDGTLVTDGAYKGTYKFTYRMNAKEMHDEVTFAVYGGADLADLYSAAGTNQGTSFVYSLANYFQKLIDKNSGDANLVALAKATLAYGSYAQIAFGYNVDTAGTLGDITDVTAETLQGHAMTKTTELPTGLTLSEMTLVLKTETKICLYFDAADISGYSFKLDGKDVTPTKTTDKGYCIEIANVSAKDLDKQHTLAINGSCELTFDALSYAYAVVNSNTDANLCNAVKALYKYNQAANVYFGS